MYLHLLHLVQQHMYIRGITIPKPTYTYIYTIHEPKKHAYAPTIPHPSAHIHTSYH